MSVAAAAAGSVIAGHATKTTSVLAHWAEVRATGRRLCVV